MSEWRLIRREEIGDGRVTIEIKNDRGRTTIWTTNIGAPDDVAVDPQAVGPRRKALEAFDSHVEEMNARLHFKKKGTIEAQICRELHDKTGKVEKAWRAAGGKYGRVANRRGNMVQGPILTDRQRGEYVRLWNQIRPRGQTINECG